MASNWRRFGVRSVEKHGFSACMSMFISNRDERTTTTTMRQDERAERTTRVAPSRRRSGPVFSSLPSLRARHATSDPQTISAGGQGRTWESKGRTYPLTRSRLEVEEAVSPVEGVSPLLAWSR